MNDEEIGEILNTMPKENKFVITHLDFLKYIKDLQSQLEKLTQENNDLEERVIHQDNIIKGLQEELQKADSITQSCIYDGKKESSLNFRKAINLVDEFRKENKDLQSVIDKAIEFTEKEIYYCLSSGDNIYHYLDKLLEILRSKE